jgi:hypothetical protein
MRIILIPEAIIIASVNVVALTPEDPLADNCLLDVFGIHSGCPAGKPLNEIKLFGCNYFNFTSPFWSPF